MNIVNAPSQNTPTATVASDVRSPPDEGKLLPGNSLIPPITPAPGNAGGGRAGGNTGGTNTGGTNTVGTNTAGGNNDEQKNSPLAANSGEANGLVAVQLTEAEKREVAELAARDREVRAHEAAHANVGGRYAGAATFSFQRGPDGKSYAVGGEVSIDTSPIPNDPKATIIKAQVVRRAALAPAQPSSQDRAVAAEAAAIERTARQELAAEQAGERVNDVAAAGSQTKTTPAGLPGNQAVNTFASVAALSGDAAFTDTLLVDISV